MLLRILPLVVVLAGTVPTRVQDVCPGDDSRSREIILRFLTRAGYEQNRQAIGFVSTVGPSEVRLLTDATDATTCQRIVAQGGASGSQPEWRWTAYQVRGHFFVAFRHVSLDGSLWMGHTPLYVLDGNLQLLYAVAL
jgi:hypothetical protein